METNKFTKIENLGFLMEKYIKPWTLLLSLIIGALLYNYSDYSDIMFYLSFLFLGYSTICIVIMIIFAFILNPLNSWRQK